MATTTEEIRSWFTADITGLESADKKQDALARKAIARERELTRTLMDAERKRSAAANDFAGKLTGLRDPISTVEKLGSSMADKLAKSFKFSAIGAGVMTAGISLAVEGLREMSVASKELMDDLRAVSEASRRVLNKNVFSRGSLNTGGLISARTETHSQLEEQKARQQTLNPTTGIEQAKLNLSYMTQFGTLEEAQTRLASDRADAKEKVRRLTGDELALTKQIVAAQLADANTTKEQLTRSTRGAEIMRMEAASIEAVKNARTGGATQAEGEKIRADYALRIAALREIESLEKKHYAQSFKESAIQMQNASPEVKSFAANKLVVEAAREELNTRKFITVEEERTLDIRARGAEAEIAAIHIAREERKRSILQDRMSTGLRLGVSTGSAGVYDAMAAKGNAMREADKEQLLPQDKKRLSDTHDLRIRDAQNAVKIEAQRYDLASRIQDVEAANTTSAQQRYRVSELQAGALRQELATRRGLLTIEREREIAQGLKGSSDTIRTIRREVGYGKGEGQILAGLRDDAAEKLKRDMFDSRTASRDGLLRVQRDLSGNITSGIDMVTGQRRAPYSIGAMMKPETGGINDVNKGSTALSGIRAMVDAQDISNRYLENISRQMDKMGLA